MDIDDYVKTFNLVPKNVCETLITNYENDNEWKQHKWYSPADDSLESKHSKELDVLYNKQLSVLDQYIAQALTKYYEATGLKNLVTNYSNVRLNKYKTGTVMSEHYDLIRRNQGDGIPVLTFLGLLNDNFKGGQFVLRNKDMDFKQGDIMIFPSTFIYPHYVKEVIEGTRYSFVTWSY